MYVDENGEPLVTGAGSYADAVEIIKKYGMSIDYQIMDLNDQRYCQVNIDTSALDGLATYEDEAFISAVENY